MEKALGRRIKREMWVRDRGKGEGRERYRESGRGGTKREWGDGRGGETERANGTEKKLKREDNEKVSKSNEARERENAKSFFSLLVQRYTHSREIAEKGLRDQFVGKWT